MKPDTTWKEEVVSHAKEYARMSYLVSEENHSPNEEISALDRLLGVVESFLSSSQALARREGIEEAMRVVRGMDMGSICSAHQKRDPLCQMCNSSDKYNMTLRHVVEALQEKLDTKGV